MQMPRHSRRLVRLGPAVSWQSSRLLPQLVLGARR